jgi:cell division inhibitor SepF
MASAMRKMAVYLGLVEEDHLDEDDYYESASSYEDRYGSRPSSTAVRTVDTSRSSEPSRSSSSRNDVRDIESRVPRASSTRSDDTDAIERIDRADPYRRVPATPSPVDGHYRITALHPRSYNDARRIGEEFREATPVIINLSEMDDADAKRIIDFSAGLVFALHGTIERVTNKVFLLSPANVDVGAEARAQIAQDGFFNQS